ncbi:MAG TPA: TSUP family transporter [Chitinophagaceae bacterium]|nr:TSUP family transporter [Chitinophagaceae bacterium]
MHSTGDMLLLCIAAFIAGFVDAIIGGGGLIQTPTALVVLPQYPVATVIGTIKIPAFCGTSLASIQYARNVKLDFLMLTVMMVVAASAAFGGSALLTVISNSFMKPFILIVLVLVAIYTFSNKAFGIHAAKDHTASQQWIYCIVISLVLGFYDGFIGPGAGSFLVLAFIGFLGFDFLRSSAHAKFVNLSTNFGSIIFFALKGKIIYPIALPMAVCNALGGLLGARLAILKGNKFIRIFFLVIVCITILRFAYDVFFK